MSLRRWVREQMLGGDPAGDDVPPRGALVSSAFKRDEERASALGEYDSANYPTDLAELLRRREAVMQAFMRLDVTHAEGRVAAIDRLKELLREYPHPLIYETLIHAYAEAGRYDEARGVAFAARERRRECARSPYPEIQAETDLLQEWKPQDVEALRESLERSQQR